MLLATPFSLTFGQNLVTNPGFELPGFTLSPNYRYLNGGNATLLTGWTFSHDGVNEPSYVYHRSRYPVFAGNYSVQFGDGDSCSMSVPTEPDCGYVLSITFVGDDGGGVRFRAGSLDATANPNTDSVGTGVFYSSGTEWRRVHLPFTALSASTIVTINDIGQGRPFGGCILDEIAVVRGVAITRQPTSSSTCPSGTTDFSVSAVGVGPLSFQWQFESSANTWLDATNGLIPYSSGTITASSVTTEQLQLSLNTANGVTPIRFRCVVTNSCGSATSEPATLAPCQADFTCDGQVDDADFVGFAAAYNILDCADPAMSATCPADLNGDGFVDDSDFVLFAAAYNELGCI